MQAFTLIELAVLIFVLILVVVATIPGIRAAKRSALRRDCVNNLKQVGLAYRTWPQDSTDEFPQSVAVTNGGSKEWLAAGQLFLHYRTMSNVLTTPKILVCPADNLKVPAASFGAGFSDTNSSYFVSWDASETYPQTFLTGDRNLALSGKAAQAGVLILSTNSPAVLSWTKSIHDSCGNICLGDGSVQQFFEQKRLNAAVRYQDLATNRLVLP
jgi:type II secretory pathway pseudopilin PulG